MLRLTAALAFFVGVFSCASASAAMFSTANSYAILGGSTITNTGPTTINGNIGLSPGTSITGAGSITLIGGSTTHNSDAAAAQAQSDETAAYLALQLLPFTTDLSGQNLGGLTLFPGVYRFSSSAQLTGILTLNAQNNPNSVFVFQIGSTLTTASAANVNVINGNQGTGVYFQVGSSATLGTNTTFAGNILALQSITLNTNASILCGRAFAQNGAITLDTNVISDGCGVYNASSGRTDFGSSGFDGTPNSPTVPEPATFALVILALGAMPLFRRGLSARSQA